MACWTVGYAFFAPRVLHFSAFLVFNCADNNRASIVLSAFVEAAHIHGLPERIRSDHGGENIEVWRFMVQQHGSASSVITGSSTHNERI